MNPFKPAGCTCSSTNGLRAALEGKSLGLCPVHHAPQIEAQQAAREQYESQIESARLAEFFERTTARIAQQQMATAAQQAVAERQSQAERIADPLERSLTFQTDPTLEAPPTYLDVFRSHLYGRPGTNNPDSPDDGNTAA